MQMRITISGIGFTIGKTGLGVNVLAGAYIEIRAFNGFTPCTLGLIKGPGLGTESGTLVFGHIQTEWFSVSRERYPWLTKSDSLIGKTAHIEVTGAIVAGGRVVIKLTFISDDGDVTSLMSKANIKSSGFQLSATKVTGTVRRIPAGSRSAA